MGPGTTEAPAQPTILDLNCLVLGDDPNRIFNVKIADSEKVNALKMAIKDAKSPDFDIAPADAINILKVSLPDDHDLQAKLQNFRSEEDPENGVHSLSSPMKRLKDVIGDLNDYHVHVIVLRPSVADYVSNSSKRPCLDPGIDDAYYFVYKGLYDLFWGVHESPHFHTLSTPIPDERTLDIESVPESTFTMIGLPDGFSFPENTSVMLVPKIYETFLELVREIDSTYQERQRNLLPVFPSQETTVITGQPGIGKTMFLGYVLVRRLQEKMVTIYCDKEKFAYVFSDAGVRCVKLTSHNIHELETDIGCCALVNLGATMTVAPTQFQPSHRKGRVLIAASPDEKHVEAYKEHTPGTLYMPTWGWNDLYCASLLRFGKLTPKNHHITNDKEHNKTLQEAYVMFAGIPRICFNYFGSADRKLVFEGLDSALERLSLSENLSLNLRGLTPMEYPISHKLVKINPDPTDSSFTKHEVTFISDYIAERVFLRMKYIKDAKLAETIFEGFRDPMRCARAGKLFEIAAHRTFQYGFDIRPTALTTDAPALTITIEGDPYYFFSLDVRAGTGSRIDSVSPDYLKRYLIPWSKISDSVDALWISKDITVFFQMTKQLCHGMKFEGMFTLLKELASNATKNVCLLFVIPDDVSTESFGRQVITFPIGTKQEDREKYERFPQYVYRLRRSDVDCV